MNEEKLIALVRHYEFLYDTAHPKYMDGPKKDAAWSEISHVLNQPASACKHKWQSLRDAYRRALNKRKFRMGIGQPMTKIKKWKFEEEISFLSKYLADRKKTNTTEEEITQNDGENENASNPEVAGSADVLRNDKEDTDQTQLYSMPLDSSLFASMTTPLTPSTQKNSQKWITSQGTPPTYIATNFIEEVSKESEITHDQMDLFFLNISNTVKSFSPYLQAIAKNKIFNLVSELEIQQLTPAKTNIPTPQTPSISKDTIWTQEPNSAHVYIKVEKSPEIDRI